MKHVIALIAKFAMVAITLELVLGFLTALTISDILYISLPLTVIAYLIGDILILDKTNNTVATAADAGLAFGALLLVPLVIRGVYVPMLAAGLAAVALAAGEFLFHKYIRSVVYSS